MGKAYKFSQVLKCLLIMVAVMLAMKFSGGAGFLVVVPLILMSLMRGDSVQLFFYLMVTVSMLMGNAYLMPKDMAFGLAQRGLMVLLGSAMALRCAGQRNSPVVKPLLLLILYLVVAAVSSLQGWNAMISYMKLFLFLMIFLAYYGVANEVAQSSQHGVVPSVRAAFLAVAIFFILGSVLLLPFPAIGQLTGEEFEEALRNGKTMTSLFKGMTMHSQSLGPIVVMLFVVLLGDMVLSIRRADKLYMLLLLLCPVLVYKTSSRTAMGGLLFGAMLLLNGVMRARGLRVGWKGKVVSVFMLILTLGLVAALLIPSVRDSISSFALKSQNAGFEDVNMEQLTSSRKGKWEEGIANFKRSPVIGNGFQVSANMMGYEPGFTTLSAPVEKSVWISAVLEETGFVGFSVFLFFVLVVWMQGAKNRCYIGNTAFLTFLVLNLGEFTFFSMSHTGGFQWAMVFVAYMFDAHRNLERSRETLIPMTAKAWCGEV